VLTQADIPSYLGLMVNPSASTTVARHEGSDPHCKKAGIAVFSASGWRVPTGGSLLIILQSGSGPVVVSADLSCATPSDASRAFKSDPSLLGRPIPGIGSEATLIDLSPGQRSYGVGWRKNARIEAVFVVGPKDDKRITPGLAQLLARRAAARS